MGGPDRRGKERCARIWGEGFRNFDADFGSAFGGGTDVNDADELFFEGVGGVADENFSGAASTRMDI